MAAAMRRSPPSPPLPAGRAAWFPPASPPPGQATSWVHPSSPRLPSPVSGRPGDSGLGVQTGIHRIGRSGRCQPRKARSLRTLLVTNVTHSGLDRRTFLPHCRHSNHMPDEPHATAHGTELARLADTVRQVAREQDTVGASLTWKTADGEVSVEFRQEDFLRIVFTGDARERSYVYPPSWPAS